MNLSADYHVHTYLSKCANETATPQAYIDNAVELGLDTIVITDHMWDNANLPYNIQGDAYSERCKQWGMSYMETDADYCLAIKEEFNKIDCKGVRVLFGCECEYDYIRHRPAMTLETAKRFDAVLVPNSHTHLTMPDKYYYPYEKHCSFMIDAFYDIVNSDIAPFITAIAHPFQAVCCYYDKNILLNLITDEQYMQCFSLAREKNIAIEINLSNYPGKTKQEILQRGEIRMLKLAKEAGCHFTFGTDTHAKQSQLDAFPYASVLSDILNLSKDDLLIL